MTQPPPPPPPDWPAPRPRPPSRREWAIFGALFVATLLSSWFVYGWFWGGGSVLDDPAVARDGAMYAGGLMAILLAHEFGHYIVARRHGMDQTLPYFIPFPLAFGTLGAIIRLRVLPRSRTALLEMGAAGPIAGFVVAVLVMALGMPGTLEAAAPQMVSPWPPPPVEVPDGVGYQLLLGIDRVLGAGVDALHTLGDLPGLGWFGDWLDRTFPPFEPGSQVVMILANPPLMDVLGELILGAAPGRYATIHPLALAGWAGCFLTAMNLLPIGQLDGGHVTNALFPQAAGRISRVGLGAVLFGGVFWLGWAIWGLLLWKMGAWRSLPVPVARPPSRRALGVAAVAFACFALCFMPVPLEQDALSLHDIDLRTPEGRTITAAEKDAWLEELDEDGAPIDGADPDPAAEP